MALESQWVVDRPKAHRALSVAKERNKGRTIPVRVNSYTIVYLTPEQAADESFVERTKQVYNNAGIRTYIE